MISSLRCVHWTTLKTPLDLKRFVFACKLETMNGGEVWKVAAYEICEIL